MITPELISRYPFFADLELGDIKALAETADGVTVNAGDFIFRLIKQPLARS